MDFHENVLRISQLLNQIEIPVLRFRAYKLHCRSIGVLGNSLSRKQIVKIIRNKQKLFRPEKTLRLPFLHSHKLIDCIENLLLDSRSGI